MFNVGPLAFEMFDAGTTLLILLVVALDVDAAAAAAALATVALGVRQLASFVGDDTVECDGIV